MGFLDFIEAPFKAVGHAVETVYDDAKEGVETVWTGIKTVAEHVEKDGGAILTHAEHDVEGVAHWAGGEFDHLREDAEGLLNTAEMMPYLAAGLVIFLVMNANKTSQVIDSGANAAARFR